jgi:hypothetical protein
MIVSQVIPEEAVACQRDGFWREFRDQVTVGGCWRGRSASGADVVLWLGASGF